MSTNQSETQFPLIYRLIPQVMRAIGAVSKDRKNEQQKYSFRGIEDFYQAAHPALIEYGVFCAPTVLDREEYRFEKTNFDGKITTWLHVALKVEHRFYASDGSYVPVTTWGEGLDNSDKASNKAMSGAMKYALIELFCVPTKDVEDSDRDSPEQGSKRKNANVTTQPIPISRPKPTAAEYAQHNPPVNALSAMDYRQAPARIDNDALDDRNYAPDMEKAVKDAATKGPLITYCNAADNKTFYASIREALPAELKSMHEDWGRAWLKDKGYTKDEKGKMVGSLAKCDKAMLPEVMRDVMKTIADLNERTNRPWEKTI